MIIIPTTGLKKDFAEVQKRVDSLKASSRWIQVDVCDGVFTAGKTFELELLNKIDGGTDNVLWDIHLMVKEPAVWLNKCVFVGASRVTGEVEIMNDREEFVNAVKNEGIDAGLAFDIDTEIKDIPEETDLVLLMGRKAGFDPAEINEKLWKKIELANKLNATREKPFTIAVDGGANLENIKRLEESGVDVVYSEVSYFELINAK